MKKISKKFRGFSLMEIMVSMFIFSIIITAVVGVFARSTSSFKAARNIQRNLEDAQYAMNLMAKTIRTSSVVRCGSNNPCTTAGTYTVIRVFDYSQDKCIRYQVVGNKIQSSISNNTHDADDIANGVTTVAKDWCGGLFDTDFGAFSDMTGYVGNMSFYVVPSAAPVPGTPGIVGRVTISTIICSDSGSTCSGTEKGDVIIQSSVSLRDYVVSGI